MLLPITLHFHSTYLGYLEGIVILDLVSFLSILNMAAAAILDFCNVRNLLAQGTQKAEVHRQAKFLQRRSIHCEDIAIFRLFKMAAVCHVGFVWSIVGPPAYSM